MLLHPGTEQGLPMAEALNATGDATKDKEHSQCVDRGGDI